MLRRGRNRQIKVAQVVSINRERARARRSKHPSVRSASSPSMVSVNGTANQSLGAAPPPGALRWLPSYSSFCAAASRREFARKRAASKKTKRISDTVFGFGLPLWVP